MTITVVLLLLTTIAIGITYVAHLQRRLLESQDALIKHFIELVKVELDESVLQPDSDLREFLSMQK